MCLPMKVSLGFDETFSKVLNFGKICGPIRVMRFVTAFFFPAVANCRTRLDVRVYWYLKAMRLSF